MDTEGKVFKSLSLAHLIGATIILVIGPIVGAVASYSHSQAGIDTRFVQAKLDQEEKFVKKDDFNDVSKEIRQIRDDVVSIKTILQRRR